MTTTQSREVGWIRELVVEPLGSALVADALVGDTVLQVNRISHFDEKGGTLQLNDALIGYAGVDADAKTVLLNGPLVEAADTDDFVAVWDVENAAPAEDMLGMVELLNVDGDDDPIPAKLNHALSSMLPLGPRDGRGETVWVEQYGNRWTIIDIIGKQHRLDLTAADPDSLAGKTKPKAPTGLILISSTFTDAGVTRGRISAGWDAVTENVDGDPLTEEDLSYYEFQIQEGTGGPGAWLAGVTTAPDELTAQIGPLEVAATYAGRVRVATTKQVLSDWSEIATVTIAADGTAPNKPSTPGATNRLGVHTVTWDGKDFLGNPMPPDFAYCELHKSTVNGFTPTPGDLTTLVYRFNGAGKFNTPGTYDVTDYFKLIAIDTSGNASTPSNQATSVTKPLVDVSNFPDDAMDVLYARTAHFIDATADNFAANKIQADWCDIGLLTAMILRGAQMETHAGTFRGVKINDDGIKAYDSSGTNPTPTFQVDAVTGAVTARGQFRTADSGQRIVIDAGGTITAYSSSGNVGTMYLSGSSFVFDKPIICGSGITTTSVAPSFGSLSLSGSGIEINPGVGTTHITRANIDQLNATLQSSLNCNGFNLNAVGGVTATGGIHGGDLYADNVPTTGAAINAVMGASGRFLMNTSARRYKYDDEPFEIDLDVVRQLEHKRFRRYDDEHYDEADPHAGRWYYGVIADEGQQLGLDPWLIFDGDGELQSWDYPGFATAVALAVARVTGDHEARLTAAGL